MPLLDDARLAREAAPAVSNPAVSTTAPATPAGGSPRFSPIRSANAASLPEPAQPLSEPGKPRLAPRTLDVRTAHLVTSLMRDVIRRGTGRAAMDLKRNDLAGKTGTTNDYIDAWFCGYHPTVVGIAWIGFDQPKRMGTGETGGAAALPIWIGYMERALKGVPESYMDVPEGLTAITTESPSGKEQKELIYKEQLPADEWSDPADPLPATGPAQTPAPVSDAKSKPVVR